MKKLLIILIFVIFLVGCSYQDGKLSFDLNKIKKITPKTQEEQEETKTELEIKQEKIINELKDFCPSLTNCKIIGSGRWVNEYELYPKTCDNFSEYNSKGFIWVQKEGLYVGDSPFEYEYCLIREETGENINVILCEMTFKKKGILDENGMVIFQNLFIYVDTKYDKRDNSLIEQKCNVDGR